MRAGIMPFLPVPCLTFLLCSVVCDKVIYRMRFFCILTLTGLSFCSAMCLNARAELVNGIRAIVADSIITYQQVELLVGRDADFIRHQYQNNPQEYQLRMVDLMGKGLTNLIQRELVLHDFQNSGFNVPETIIDEIVQDRIKEKYSDRVQLTKQLQKEGLTFEQFKKQIRDDLIYREMYRKNVPETIMSPHKIETFYQEHQADFKVADEIKTRIIVLNKPADDTEGSTKKRAQEIISQLKNGAAFSEMASVYSEGSTRAQGGDAGWQETSVVLKPIAEAVSKLKSGEYTDVIETPTACFLVLLEDRRPAHVKPLRDVQDDIERTLTAQENFRLYRKWIDRIEKKTFVRFFF
ncbi:PpiC-type peptidyl-prolyl cis-trans isomerase [Pedosphaera parvula Ellin514]|uniref:PpiC-type peptidyl-prolyl cis-trans isomerase n=2 Tax=Pedosphaera TaxID=1032526 RepID=B9XEU5_PEDPL|nr:PpiC-type peptidyl-prolyl cis-trans isomerase [Pedosphaera parvula Ellin514]